MHMCTLATIYGGGQRSTLWSRSLPVTLLWVPYIYSGHQASGSKHLLLLSHKASLISLPRQALTTLLRLA